MSNRFTRLARVAVIAFMAAIVAGCTTWEIPENVVAELGIEAGGNDISITYNNLKRSYIWCTSSSTDSKFGETDRCLGGPRLTPDQVAIFKKYLNPTEEDDEAAESTPVPGQIDTAVPGGTPSTCGGLYNPC